MALLIERMIEDESDAEVIISEIITRSDKTPEDHIKALKQVLQ